jgi:hypothetical protein
MLREHDRAAAAKPAPARSLVKYAQVSAEA